MKTVLRNGNCLFRIYRPSVARKLITNSVRVHISMDVIKCTWEEWRACGGDSELVKFLIPFEVTLSFSGEQDSYHHDANLQD